MPDFLKKLFIPIRGCEEDIMSLKSELQNVIYPYKGL